MSVLRKIAQHVYWNPPGPPDRPSICAVVGDRRTLMLDAGSSAAHTRAFLADLVAETGTRPSAVVYTHSHWDHVLGGAELGGLVIAHAQTAEQLLALAERDWSDEGLDRRVAAGLSSPQHAADVKAERRRAATLQPVCREIRGRAVRALDDQIRLVPTLHVDRRRTATTLT
jgi:glyoxylase-like metal-dependent hydrolase (beta-lactamase superfamily II)